MRKITRKQLLKGGAAGVASVAALPFASSVVLASKNGEGVAVHVHGTVRANDDVVDINIDAAGREAELSGAGWDNDKFDLQTKTEENVCYFSQRGELEGDTIRLRGVVFLANDKNNLGASVKTEASLETGDITWTFGPGPSFPPTVVFTGKGVVTKIG